MSFIFATLLCGAYCLSFREEEGWDGKGPHCPGPIVSMNLAFFCLSWLYIIFSHLHSELLTPLLSIFVCQLLLELLATLAVLIAVYGFSS